MNTDLSIQFSTHDVHNWYVVYSGPRSERKLSTQLSDTGWVVYLPEYKELRQWSDRKKWVTLPLIPSVVFVRCSPAELSKLYSVPGVRHILKSLGKPAIVQEHEIENLKLLLQDWTGKLDVHESEERFTAGEWVEIVKGPMKGLKGHSMQLVGKHKLLIEIKALGLQYTLQIAKSALKKVPQQATESVG